MPKKMPIAGSDALRPLKTQQDEQRYTPTPRREKLPAPTVGIFDEPVRCIKINLEWWSHISGMIDTLSSPELWLGDSTEQTRAITEIAKLLSEAHCMDCTDVEDCLGSSTIINNIETDITNNTTNITNNTTNITNITGEVEEIQAREGSKNITPPASSYAGDDLCNASDYAAQQALDKVLDIFNQKNNSDYAAWLSDLMLNGGGYIANWAENIWSAVNGNYANMAVDLVLAHPQVQQALIDADMDKAAAAAAIFNDTTVPFEVRNAVSNILIGVTEGLFADWGFIGAETNAGGCISTTAWQWSYPASACTYGLPSGFALNIGAATCGNGTGAFDGIYRVRNSVAAEINATLTLASPIPINEIHVRGLCNLPASAGYSDGTIRVSVFNGATQVFTNSRVLPTTGYSIHDFTPNVTGDSVTFYLVQNFLTQNPTGVLMDKISVNAALL